VASYANAGQRWTFFEIDPAIVRIAQSGEYFGFLKSCENRCGPETCEVVLGDARRRLTRHSDGTFDLLMLDGFCSDAMPVHLLTREAIALYVRKLKPGGVLAVHVTNQHLDLAPLVTRLAADHDPPLSVRYRHDVATEAMRAEGKSSSEWMILARDDAALGPVSWDPYWDRVKVVPGPVWRDDFANVLATWRKASHD
jgi:hypothetical protein